MNFDFSKLLEISARAACAILFACIVFLFFPQEYLPFDITYIRIKYGVWIFILFTILVSTILSYLIKWISKILKEKHEIHKTWSTYKYILKSLSKKEKAFLKNKYESNENTLMINLLDPMHKHLQTLNILSQNAGTSIGHPTAMPGFVQPWVFEMIKKHPNLLKAEEKSPKQ